MYYTKADRSGCYVLTPSKGSQKIPDICKLNSNAENGYKNMYCDSAYGIEDCFILHYSTNLMRQM